MNVWVMNATRRPNARKSNRRPRRADLRAISLAGLLIFASPAAWGDFQAGWKAYESGNFTAAYNEWQKLAERGDPKAQFNLGVLYDEGRGVTRDRSKAIELWTRAAENGDPQAQHNIALAYLAGKSVV